MKELNTFLHLVFSFPALSGFCVLSRIFVCWSVYHIFDSSSLWPVSLVKRFPSLAACADRGQLPTVPWSFPKERCWDLIFSQRVQSEIHVRSPKSSQNPDRTHVWGIIFHHSPLLQDSLGVQLLSYTWFELHSLFIFSTEVNSNVC